MLECSRMPHARLLLRFSMRMMMIPLLPSSILVLAVAFALGSLVDASVLQSDHKALIFVAKPENDLVLKPLATGAVLVDGADFLQELADLEDQLTLHADRQRKAAYRAPNDPQQRRQDRAAATAGSVAEILVDENNNLVLNSPEGGAVVIDGVYVVQELGRMKGMASKMQEEIAALTAAAAVTATSHTHTTRTTLTTTTPTTSTTTTVTTRTTTTASTTTLTTLTTTTLTTTTVTTITTTTTTELKLSPDGGTLTCDCNACESALDNVQILDGTLLFKGDLRGCSQAQFNRIVKGLVKVTGDVNFISATWTSGFKLEFPNLKEIGGTMELDNGCGGMNYLDYPVLGKVGGSWRIANYANPTLETAFAPKLKVVGSTFYSGHCRGLKIYKFPSLTTVGGDFTCHNHPQLHHDNTDFSRMKTILGKQLHLNSNLGYAFSCTNNKVTAVVTACNNKDESPDCKPYTGIHYQRGDRNCA